MKNFGKVCISLCRIYYLEEVIRLELENDIKVTIEKCIASLEDNHKLMNTFRRSYDDVISRQCKMMVELGTHLNPIIIFLKERNYKFYNSELDYYSLDGPVIGLSGDVLYTYTGNGYLVDYYNIYTKETKAVSVDKFLREHSFKTAINSLLTVLNIQNDVIKEYQSLIDDAESELIEFSNQL
jgi:hypothetical protein